MNNVSKKQPLLSICIPTYNRASILEETLNQFINNKEIDSDVEIIISDNASDDDTQQICKKYAQICPSIKYFRNISNIRDLNFIKVLDYGEGQYLKLLNDWSYYTEADLKYIKSIIRNHLNQKEAVFFSSNYVFTKRKRDIIICNNLDEYVQSISTFVTCNNIFGVWREDWARIQNKGRFNKLQLQQVDWSYQVVKLKGCCYIYDRATLSTSSVPVGIRSGYNWFKVHLDNYYVIMSEYIKEGLISYRTYKNDSHYLLEHFKTELCHIYFFKLDRYWQYDSNGTLRLLLKYYKKDVYFYYFIFKLPFFYISQVGKRLYGYINRFLK